MRYQVTVAACLPVVPVSSDTVWSGAVEVLHVNLLVPLEGSLSEWTVFLLLFLSNGNTGGSILTHWYV